MVPFAGAREERVRERGTFHGGTGDGFIPRMSADLPGRMQAAVARRDLMFPRAFQVPEYCKRDILAPAETLFGPASLVCRRSETLSPQDQEARVPDVMRLHAEPLRRSTLFGSLPRKIRVIQFSSLTLSRALGVEAT